MLGSLRVFVLSLSESNNPATILSYWRPTPFATCLETLKKSISLADINPLVLFGRNDEHLDSIERNYRVKIVARGDHLHLNGPRESVEHVSGLLGYVVESIRRNPHLSEEEVKSILDQDQIDPGNYPPLPEIEDNGVIKTYRRTVAARTVGQARYLKAVECHDVVFAIGPAGTGKTYLQLLPPSPRFAKNAFHASCLPGPPSKQGKVWGFFLEPSKRKSTHT